MQRYVERAVTKIECDLAVGVIRSLGGVKKFKIDWVETKPELAQVQRDYDANLPRG